MSAELTIVLPIYDGVTHLDFTGPHQVFVRLPNAKVLVASLGGQPVCADGLQFSALANLEEIAVCDVLCVPGGAGCVAALEDERFLKQISRLSQSARYITSVCTGSLILGAAGLLAGKHATSHWAFRDLLPLFGAIRSDERVVRDGYVITAGGVTAGIDFSLTLIAELAGKDLAQSIQLGLEYAPDPPFASGRPEEAPAAIYAALRDKIAAESVERRAHLHAFLEKKSRPRTA
jgi:cyclohexyl-isocyanide hydratase